MYTRFGACPRQQHGASLVHGVGHHEEGDQTQDDIRLVRVGGMRVAVVIPGRSKDGAAYDRDRATHQDHQRRHVLDRGVAGPDVRESRAKTLADQRDGSDGQDQEAGKDQNVQGAGHGIPRLPGLPEPDNQQLHQAGAEMIEARIGRSQAQQPESLPHDEAEGTQREDEQDQLESRSREPEVTLCCRRRGHISELD